MAHQWWRKQVQQAPGLVADSPGGQTIPLLLGCYSYLCFTTDHYWTEFKIITWPSNLGCRCPANDAPLLLLLHSTQSLKLYISLNVLLYYFSMQNCCLALNILENLTKEFEKNNGGAWKHRYEIASFVVLNVRGWNVYVLILNWCNIVE